MNTISTQNESLTLGRCCVSKTVSTTERIVSLPAILGFCPNMGIVNPNAIYSILLHNILFLIKILFPSIYNDRLILRNNRFYQSNIMFFESISIFTDLIGLRKVSGLIYRFFNMGKRSIYSSVSPKPS